jgi:hypothetical protein
MLENTLRNDDKHMHKERAYDCKIEELGQKLHILEAVIQESPVFRYFDDIVEFISRSRGRGRERKYPQKVILLKKSGEYHYWNGSSDKATRLLPWDKWAQEAYGSSYNLISHAKNPSDFFREDLFNILETFEEIKEIKDRIKSL